MTARPGLLIIASEGFRRDPAGPFLPLVRDYCDRLRQFQLHSTKGTAITMLSTGEFTSSDPELPRHDYNPDIIVYRFGREGGVVEIAALVPMRRCEAVMFFLDPSDSYSEIPENRALQRVCKELGIRLISTFDTARHWLEFESQEVLELGARPPGAKEWGEGNPNVDEHNGAFLSLLIEEQTLALIAHDRRKEDLVLFVNQHSNFLKRFHRILTTGTTGSTLKLLFGTDRQAKAVIDAAQENLGPRRFQQLIDGAARLLLEYSVDQEAAEQRICNWTRLEKLPQHLRAWLDSEKPRTDDSPRSMLLELGEVRELIDSKGLVGPQEILVDRIYPVRSGPQGGDIILANEVLTHRCHAAVFFQDPQSAHAHDPDIRLFERTCHFWSERELKNRVFITCVSDSKSAHRWALAASSIPAAKEARSSLPEVLRRQPGWRLRDVALIDGFLEGNAPEDLGKALVEAGARYFVRELRYRLHAPGRITIGIGHGETLQRVVENLGDLMEQVPFQLDLRDPERILCVPLVGNVSQYNIQRQATAIAHELSKALRGKSDSFAAPGLIEADDFGHLSQSDLELIETLGNADLILVAGGTYGEKERKSHPVPETPARRPAGIISSIVLDEDGRPMEEKMRTVGIGFDGLRKAAARGRVIFLCAGDDRRPLLLSSMRAALVSVLVSDRRTAQWLADQSPLNPTS